MAARWLARVVRHGGSWWAETKLKIGPASVPCQPFDFIAEKTWVEDHESVPQNFKSAINRSWRFVANKPKGSPMLAHGILPFNSEPGSRRA
jgi:hypothetical protein